MPWPLRYSLLSYWPGLLIGSNNERSVFGEKHKIKAKVCILGHIQRGGSPNAIDRLYASEMGALAANSIINFTEPLVTTYNDGKVGVSPFANCLTKISGKDQRQIELTKMLAI